MHSFVYCHRRVYIHIQVCESTFGLVLVSCRVMYSGGIDRKMDSWVLLSVCLSVRFAFIIIIPN